eukprot:GEMP01052452.1.p1 GENE.GEMP01052452.1~~GEMP01052452.1.p1  ORF type:complete len:235 (+),score=64.23 GEMP01052452.1:32-706(+)
MDHSQLGSHANTESVPLTPKQNHDMDMNVYNYGFQPISEAQLKGCRTYREAQDALNHKAPVAPYPIDARAFHASKPDEDRINMQYENMLSDHLPLAGTPKPHFATKWQRAVAYHHGLYVPETHASAKTADDIRVAVADYTDKVQADTPNDACKYLQIEEFRCLQVHQLETQPREANTKCVKWFDEWQKCKWDQEKFNSGYTHIEGPQMMKKRRPYIFYPDFNYA